MGKEIVEKKEQLKEIMDRVTNKNKLFIKRVPEKAKKQFQELASEEFDGDYGFTLKFLLDFYSGLISSPNKMLMEQVQIMVREIEQLKTTKVEEPKLQNEGLEDSKNPQRKKVITSLSGRVIAERRE